METNCKSLYRVSFVGRKDECEIVPPHIVVGQNDEIVFCAHEGKVDVFFPDPDIFDPPTSSIQLMGNCEKLTISSKHTGVFPYAAYCHKFRRFARGGSDGEIIIQSRA